MTNWPGRAVQRFPAFVEDLDAVSRGGFERKTIPIWALEGRLRPGERMPSPTQIVRKTMVDYYRW